MSATRHTPVDLLKGTLDLLILQALAPGPLHGMGISRRIAQITNGAFDVKAGSLFPALYGMEESGWIAGSWGAAPGNRRARFYKLTRAGRRQLQVETNDWEKISLAITSALRAT